MLFAALLGICLFFLFVYLGYNIVRAVDQRSNLLTMFIVGFVCAFVVSALLVNRIFKKRDKHV